MNALRDLAWMRQQWRQFRRLLIGAILAVWAMCLSGILMLRTDDPEAEQWLLTRLALLIMLVVASLVAAWLLARATREINQLGRDATDMRLGLIRKERAERHHLALRRSAPQKAAATDAKLAADTNA